MNCKYYFQRVRFRYRLTITNSKLQCVDSSQDWVSAPLLVFWLLWLSWLGLLHLAFTNLWLLATTLAPTKMYGKTNQVLCPILSINNFYNLSPANNNFICKLKSLQGYRNNHYATFVMSVDMIIFKHCLFN